MQPAAWRAPRRVAPLPGGLVPSVEAQQVPLQAGRRGTGARDLLQFATLEQDNQAPRSMAILHGRLGRVVAVLGAQDWPKRARAATRRWPWRRTTNRGARSQQPFPFQFPACGSLCHSLTLLMPVSDPCLRPCPCRCSCLFSRLCLCPCAFVYTSYVTRQEPLLACFLDKQVRAHATTEREGERPAAECSCGVRTNPCRGGPTRAAGRPGGCSRRASAALGPRRQMGPARRETRLARSGAMRAGGRLGQLSGPSARTF